MTTNFYFFNVRICSAFQVFLKSILLALFRIQVSLSLAFTRLSGMQTERASPWVVFLFSIYIVCLFFVACPKQYIPRGLRKTWLYPLWALCEGLENSCKADLGATTHLCKAKIYNVSLFCFVCLKLEVVHSCGLFTNRAQIREVTHSNKVKNRLPFLGFS